MLNIFILSIYLQLQKDCYNGFLTLLIHHKKSFTIPGCTFLLYMQNPGDTHGLITLI
jgi:hypothetical protein